MAFGDSLRPADGGTVELRAETSVFNSQIERAEAQWRESVGQMSREALKLDLAQDRLKKSLANYGAESAQAKRATIGLKDAEEAAARAADKQTRETQQLDRAQRAQSTGTSNLTRRVVGLAAAYVGTYGLVSGIRSVLSAAKEEQLVHGQTRVALEALGLEYDRHRRRIELVISAVSQLGFDDEELLKSFQLLVRGTRDVDGALERVALAADVARGRYIDLESATQIVNKAGLGMSGALRRIGIDVDKNATSTELLAALTRNYGRAAEEAATTGVAAQDRLNVVLENTREIIGRGLVPTVTDLSNRISDYLSKAENQRELQQRVNEAVKTGEDVVRGFAGALQTVRAVLGPVVDLMGGLDKAIEAALIIGLVTKVRRAAASFGLIAASSRVATASVVRDAAIAGAALDVAYRPRVVGAGAFGGGGGRVGRLGRLGRFGGLAAGGLPGIAIAAGLIFGPDLIAQGKNISGSDYDKLKQAARQGRLTWAGLEELAPFLSDAQKREVSGLIAIAGARGARDEQATPVPGGDRPTPREGTRGPSELDLQLDIARRPGETGPLRALRTFYARQIQALEGREKLSKEQKERLQALYGSLSGVQSQLDAIEEEGERKLEEQREKARERRRKQREKAQAAIERDRQLRDKAEEDFRRKDERAFRGRMPPGQARMRPEAERRAAQRGGRDRAGAGAGEGEGLTEADIRRMHVDFLNMLTGARDQFGSNIDSGQTATNTWTVAQLTREQNRKLDRLTRSVQHPGAKYARVELSSAFGGVGGI